MKMITAIIRQNQIDQVRQALIDAEISRITITRVSGHGQQVEEEVYRGQKIVPNLIPKVRVDIAVNDEFVDVAVDTIIKAAKAGEGQVGDGKIFIMPLEQCIRIRTGDRGGEAI